MDQRTLLYVTLLFLGFLLWQSWQLDHAPKPDPQAQTQSTQLAEGAQTPGASDDLPGARQAVASDANLESAAPVGGKLIEVRTDVLDFTISTVGGDIVGVDLPTYPVSLEQKDTPFVLLDNASPRYIAQSGLIHDQLNGVDVPGVAPNHYAVYEAAEMSYSLAEGTDNLSVDLVWMGETGVKVTKTFHFKRGQFVVGVDFKVENGSPDVWHGRQYRQLRHGPAEDMDGSSFLQTYIGGAYYTDKYNKISFDKFSKEPVNVTVDAGGWVSIPQHYFLSAWFTPKGSTARESIYSKVIDVPGNQEYLLGMTSGSIAINPGESAILNSSFYAGPKKQNRLEELAEGLELTVDYGIFTIFSKPIFWLLTQIHALIGNWGWAIIFLTILIKALFFKLSAASYRSMAKMKTFAPKLQEIKERFGDDKQGQQQAMMDLYKKEKINPLGGCLPVLVQIPVFIALYWVLLESVELRQAPFMLWIKDLSIMDPFYVLPLLMGITMFVQQKLNPAPADPMQAKIMMALPFVFTVFFAFFPAGLVLYWFVNNLLSITQQYFISKGLEKETAKV